MTHNGGKHLVNTWFPQIDGCYPLVNHMKWGQSWNYITPSDGLYDPTKHDINGYMHTVYQNGVYNRFYIPAQADRPGNYVLQWDGTGELSIGGTHTTATNGRVVYTTPGATIDVFVHNVGTPGVDYPHNIRFCHVDDETALALDPYALGVKFKQLMTELPVGVWRHLDTLNANLSNLAHWADRMPVDHYCYNGYQCQTVPFLGTTTNSGDNYTITISGSLTDKRQVVVQWNATSTGLTPKLNGIYILGDGCWPLGSGTKPTINTQRLLTYDLDLNVWMMHNGRPGIRGHLPFELIAKFSNEIGCHARIPLPHLTLDPQTNLQTSAIDYFRDNLDAGIMPIYEAANEVGNSIFPVSLYGDCKEVGRSHTYTGPWVTGVAYTTGQLASTDFALYICLTDHTAGTFATDLAASKWAQTSDTYNWHGRALSKLGQNVCASYGDSSPDRTKYRIAAGIFPSGLGSADSQVKRLTCPNYVAETSSAKAAYHWITEGSPAYYWSSDYNGTASETTWAAEYGTATEARRNEIWNLFFEDTGGTGDQAFSNRKNASTEFSTLLATYGLTMSGYEGGYHCHKTEGSTESEPLLTFRYASHLAAIQYYTAQRNYAFWEGIGAEYFPHYVMSGTGDWSMFQSDIYDTPSPAWAGMTAWNNGTKRYRMTTGPAFDILSVFTGGIGGGYWDATDSTKVFSDAGSTQITNGGNVAQVNDKSPNGHNLIKGAASSGLVWNSAGYITFNGTNDYLHMLSSLNSFNASACSVFVLAKFNPAANAILLGDGSSSSGNPYYVLMLANSAAPSSLGGFVRNDAGTPTIISSNVVFKTSVFDNTKKTIGVIDNGSNLITPYIGSAASSTTSYSRSGSLTTDRFAIGAHLHSVASGFFAMDLYKILIVHKVLPATEIRGIVANFANT